MYHATTASPGMFSVEHTFPTYRITWMLLKHYADDNLVKMSISLASTLAESNLEVQAMNRYDWL
jgi:hypothetical protein